MVHGVGSCSGGGGFSGGFSGAGYYSNRRNDCDGRLCCSTLAVIFGVGKKQSKRSRVIIITIWLFLIFGTAGLSTAFATYGSHKTDLSPTDMRPLKKGLEATFCTGASFKSDYQLDYFLFRDVPKLSSTKTNYTLKRSTYIFSDNYEYWGYYLTAGSKVTVTSAVEHAATFYIIKASSWHRWQQSNYCSCTELNRYTGQSKYRPDIFSFVAQETGEYYFVWANHFSQSTSVSVTFDMQRVPFDLHDAELACTQAFSCNISDFQKHSQVVVYVPDLQFQDSVFVTAKCHREIGIFLAIFLCIPVIISVITGILIYFVFGRKKLSIHSVTSLTSASFPNSTNNSTSSSCASTVSQRPDSYSKTNLPPSYEEVVGQKF